MHWIREQDAVQRHTFTHCGMEGWREENSATEFTAVQGEIFEASKSLADVDCKRCLQSAKRISETCTTNPRGNHRRRRA